MAQHALKFTKRGAEPIADAQASDATSPEASIQSGKTNVDADRRRAMIAEVAYYRSLRSPSGGSDVENWLAAEQEVDADLMLSR
jgi:hypothetical protein